MRMLFLYSLKQKNEQIKISTSTLTSKIDYILYTSYFWTFDLEIMIYFLQQPVSRRKERKQRNRVSLVFLAHYCKGQGFSQYQGKIKFMLLSLPYSLEDELEFDIMVYELLKIISTNKLEEKNSWDRICTKGIIKTLPHENSMK